MKRTKKDIEKRHQQQIQMLEKKQVQIFENNKRIGEQMLYDRKQKLKAIEKEISAKFE